MIKNANKDDVIMAISGGKVLLDVWMPGCAPCRMMEPILESLDSEFADVLFIKMNGKENAEYAMAELKVRGVPAFILFENGKEVRRSVGYMTELELRNFLS